MVTLLKALTSGDISGAKSDLAKLKSDLAAQESSNGSSSLAKDMTSLLKDLSSGDSSAAKTDIAKVQKDLQSADASSSSSSKTTNPLDTLISKMETSLNSGSVQGALQDLASYLVQNGQSSGSLVDTSA
jgi:paraquat-inducible protein B